MVQVMRKFLYILTNIFFKIFYRVEVIGINKIPADGPAILCANHKTILDMFFLGFKLKRWIYWMAKEELFRNPIAAFFLRKLGAFPVRRGTGDVGSIKTAYQLLEKGQIVGIFPQGTRIKSKKMDEFKVKPGAAMIAAHTGVPVIPAAVKGNYKLFSNMKVIYGDSFVVGEGKNKKYSKEDLLNMSRDIIKRVYSLAEGI